MTASPQNPGSSSALLDDIPPAEVHLGKALALIHRVLPRLEEEEHAEAVQTALRQAVAQVTAAKALHERTVLSRRSASVEGETLALIAAAVAVVLGRPHRVLDVKPAGLPVSWVNAWAIEGRFQHYSSHNVR